MYQFWQIHVTTPRSFSSGDCDDEDDHKSQVGLIIDCDAGNEFLETPGSVPYQVKYDLSTMMKKDTSPNIV